MKLKALRLHGFKSFADATEVQFHDGITAVVGPNGCGKSNISDAIRWVLGEQRPSAIRGGKMEEAIFQGSLGRRPVNRGAVSLTVSNEDRLLPIAFQEVELGRTVYRDGGSEYTINRSACRLRDVVDLCRDTGLGANAYSVIESRMIDAILSDRAEERRAMFEEASGIGKYKDRRKAAIRRLEHAETDLQRLEDVMGEVESKVRSLARQKGRAQRYLELRARRLDVEVTVVGRRLVELEERRRTVEAELSTDGPSGASFMAELTAAESEYETLRMTEVDAEKQRLTAARALEDIRAGLAHWERDLAVAVERTASATRRLEQIERDRSEALERQGSARADLEALDASTAEKSQAVETVRARVEERRAAAEAVRSRLQEARGNMEEIELREHAAARRSAQLEGDREGADAQAAELALRLERLRTEIEGATSLVADLESQGDLFSDRIASLVEEVAAARTRVGQLEDRVASARASLHQARETERLAVEQATSVRARLAALERLEREQAGVAPAVQAALEQAPAPVLGRLLDFVSGPPEILGSVEALLGAVSQGLVVERARDAEAIRQWFVESWGGSGGLYLLPLDRVPPASGEGSLAKRLELSGAGAAWAEVLLAEVDLVDEGDLMSGSGPRLAADGASVDKLGIVRLGTPDGGGGVLERRRMLEALGAEAAEVVPLAEAATSGREAAEAELASAESGLEDARKALRAAEDQEREVRSEVAAQSDQRSRIDRHRDELARQMDGVLAAQTRATERGRAATEEREGLDAEVATLREAREEARERLESVQGEWEQAHARESEEAVELARLESDVARFHERVEHLREVERGVEVRLGALAEEEAQLRTDLEEAARTREVGEREMEGLFAQRDAATEELRAKEQVYLGIAEAVAAAEQRVRVARARERQATERRHQLELERQEVANRIERLRERVETEWKKDFEQLRGEATVLDDDPEALETELADLVERLGRIGPVNLLAVEEHEEESRRLDFLREQHADLISARDDLRAAIRHINETATGLFFDTFDQIRANFQQTFERLFQGGEADLWLADPDDPLESQIEIHASPRGKKTQRIDLLSGGERALTALSLLFGIYLVKPSPFCVLDEVDAPLDESNIERFIRLLQEFKADTQFVVITHNPRTIEAADWIYGVTMEEPGVSNIVGVRLEDALDVSGNAA